MRRPTPLRRSSSLCTERGSILSSVSRSNSLASNSATIGSSSLRFPARTESPVEHPGGLDYPWPQSRGTGHVQHWGVAGPFMPPTRPESCPPDSNAFGASLRAMDMMPYSEVASPISSSTDSDSEHTSSDESEPALGLAHRTGVSPDASQSGVGFQRLRRTREPWLDRSHASHHEVSDVNGDHHPLRRPGPKRRSRNVRFANEDDPVNTEPSVKPLSDVQQDWPRHHLRAPEAHSLRPEPLIYPINTVLAHLNIPSPAVDNSSSEGLAYNQHRHLPPAPHRSITTNILNNNAPPFDSIQASSSRPSLGVNTRIKKQVRISPIVDFAPTSFPHSQETRQPPSPSGYSSVSESVAGPQTPPNDMRIIHVPVVSEDIVSSNTQAPYGESQKISRQMSITEIIAHLVKHGCRNVTNQLDLNTFGQFPIANGGYSDVYRGWLRGGQQVAVKSLRVDAQSLSQNPRHLKHAARELHTWGKCNHPNVLQLLGLAIFRDRIGMVSPWMNEGSLTQYLRRVPGVNKCSMCAQIADGLAYMHRIGIAHGDVKGANVLVSSNGVPALTDFGNSHLQERTLGFTQSTNGGAMTLRWSAPEVIRDSCASNKAADIYALGMTILEILTGEPPYYYIRSESSVMLRVVNNKEHPLRPEVIPINSHDGNRLWDLLVACWSYRPEARPSGEVVFDTMRSVTPQGLVSW